MVKTKILFCSVFVLLVLTSFAIAQVAEEGSVETCFRDYDLDKDVDGSDAFKFKQDIEKFKEDYGRMDCSETNPCFIDYDSDGDVDGSDAFKFKQDIEKFKEDYGRMDCATEPTPTDSLAPIVTLLDPEDNDEYKTSRENIDITFDYSVSDESEISYCELIIDGDVEERDETIEKDVKQEFIEELDSDENYEWKIKCVDVYGNEGISEEFDLEIKEKEKSNGGEKSKILNQGLEYEETENEYLAVTQKPIVIDDEQAPLKTSKEYSNLSIILLVLLIFLIILVLIMILIFNDK